MKGQVKGQAKRGPDKTSDSISFFIGLLGLIAVLGAGVFVPLKVAEVMFGYSLSDAFWDVRQTTQEDIERARRDDVERARR